MELLIAMCFVVGFAVISGFIAGLIVISIHYRNDSELFIFTFFGFGVMLAKDYHFKSKVNIANKSKGRSFFVIAPYWFNKYVYNFGVK